jgi:hypothetical protein
VSEFGLQLTKNLMAPFVHLAGFQVKRRCQFDQNGINEDGDVIKGVHWV